MSDDNQNPNDDDDGGGLWVPIAELARRKGVTKQTMWEKVTKLEGQGLLTTKPGRGGVKLVNVGEYEFRIKETGDLAKEQAAATAQGNLEDPAYRKAQLQKVQAEAALKDFELRQRHGELVDITRVKEVIAEVGEELRKPLDQLPSRADEVNAAAVSGGAAAVRNKLKEIGFELRAAFAEALRKLDLRTKGGSSPA
jgi:hypothetical protein